MNKVYSVHYLEDGDFSPEQYEVVLAPNTADAYKKFMDNHNWTIYSAWVSNVTYQNGNVHYFNNFSGKAY